MDSVLRFKIKIPSAVPKVLFYRFFKCTSVRALLFTLVDLTRSIIYCELLNT